MPYTIEKVSDEPIVILAVESRQIMTEVAALVDDLIAVLDVQPEPVFLVLDVTGMVVSLDDVTSGATFVARGPGALLHHPNVRTNLMVSRDGIIKMTAQGLRTPVFGSVKMDVFETVEQALAYSRERIAAGVAGAE